MRRPLVHTLTRSAVRVALLSILTGAFQMSEMISAGPLAAPGLHIFTGGATVILLLVILCAVHSSADLRWARLPAIGVFFLAVVTGASFRLPMLHAGAAPVFCTATLCLALRLAPTWDNSAEPFDCTRWPRLPGLVRVTLALVALQVFLGVAYRHRAIGVMPHLAVAMLVTLAVLGLGVFILQSLPDHRAMHSAAATALTVTLIQVALGAAVFVMALVDEGTSLIAVLFIAGHVLTGSLMLAASALLAIHVGRSARMV